MHIDTNAFTAHSCRARIVNKSHLLTAIANVAIILNDNLPPTELSNIMYDFSKDWLDIYGDVEYVEYKNAIYLRDILEEWFAKHPSKYQIPQSARIIADKIVDKVWLSSLSPRHKPLIITFNLLEIIILTWGAIYLIYSYFK